MKNTAIIISVLIFSISTQAKLSYKAQSFSFPLNPEKTEELQLKELSQELRSSSFCGKVYTFDRQNVPDLDIKEADFLAFVDAGAIFRLKPSLLSYLPIKRFKPKSLFSYNSPDSSLFIGVNKDSNPKPAWSHLRTQLDQHLLNKLLLVGQRMFVDEMRGLNLASPNTNAAYELFESLFQNPKSRLPLNTRQRIDLISTFYPEIEEEIISDRQSNLRDLRPMLCYIHQDRLNYQRLQMITHVASVVAFATGVAAVAVATHGAAVPLGLAVVATTAGVVTGTTDLLRALSRFSYASEASRIGKIFEKISVNLSAELEKLDKFPEDIAPSRREQLLALRLKFDSIAARRGNHGSLHRASLMTRMEIAGALSALITAGFVDIDAGILLQVIDFLADY